MSNPFVRVIAGSPDEQTINDVLTEHSRAGARLVSLSVVGDSKVVLLFEGKARGTSRVANDTSAVQR